MSRLVFNIFCLLFLSILICSCSDNVVAGNGTGTSAGDAEIARIVLPDGSAAKKVSTELWKLNEIENSIDSIGVINSNENGNVKLSELSDGWWNLRAFYDQQFSSSKWMNVKDGRSFTLDTLYLNYNKSLNGFIHESSLPRADVRLILFNDTVYSAADGNFEFKNVPEGSHIVEISWENVDEISRNEYVLIKSSAYDVIELDDLPYIYLENFESWDHHNMLGNLFNKGWWFQSGDDLFGGESELSPNLGDTDFIVYDSDRGSKAAYTNFIMDENYDIPYVLFGFDLVYSHLNPDVHRFYDLSEATSVSFWAKGAGNILFQVIVEDTLNVNGVSPIDYKIVLNQEWVQYKIGAIDLDYDLKNVHGFNFASKENGKFWLDDIRIEGVSVIDLLKQF